MPKKEDARITRSKRDLRSALLLLLRDNAFDKITVTEICRTATINKMTFYKYYQDKYMLLDDCIRVMAADVTDKNLGEDRRDAFRRDLVGCLERVLISAYTSCYEQKEIIRSMIYGENMAISTIVRKCVERSVNELVECLGEVYTLAANPQDITAFLVGGLSGVFAKDLFSQDVTPRVLEKRCRRFLENLADSNLLVVGGFHKEQPASANDRQPTVT